MKKNNLIGVLTTGILVVSLAACAISNPPSTPNETDSSISLSKDEDVSDTDTKSSEVDKDIVIFGSKDIILTKNDSCTFDILVDDSIDKIVLKSDTTDDLFTYTLDMGETTKMYTLKIIGGTETGSCKIWLEGNTGVVSDIINFKNEKVIKQESSSKEESKQESSKEESKQESSKQESKTEVKEYKTYSYDTLARNPDKYSGEHIKLYGEVIQVQESDSWFSDDTSVELRVDMTPTKSSYAKSGFNWDDTVYVKYTYKSDEDKILEDDIVEIRGTIYGSYSYTSVLGNSITLPRIDADSVRVITDYSNIPFTTSNGETVKESDVKYEIIDQYFNTYNSSYSDSLYYSGWVAIKNTGKVDIYIDDCTFDIEDTNGSLILNDSYTRKCPNVIKAGQVGYCYSYNDLPEEAKGKSLWLNPNVKVELITKDVKYHTVSDEKITSSTYSREIVGRVTNSSSEEEDIYIDYQLFDTNGRFLWGGQVSVYDVAANNTQSFSERISLPDDLDKKQIGSFKCIAMTNYYQ